MTSIQLLLAPIFLHVVLVYFIGIRTIRARIASVRSRETKLAEVALTNANWPPHIRKLSNNFDNQFDVPTTWYALCGLIIATSKTDAILAALSCAFFITRVIHTYIHIGTNDVPNRMYAYLAGIGVLVAMWVWFAVKVFVG
jgi:hypothetical protein